MPHQARHCRARVDMSISTQSGSSDLSFVEAAPSSWKVFAACTIQYSSLRYCIDVEYFGTGDLRPKKYLWNPKRVPGHCGTTSQPMLGGSFENSASDDGVGDKLRCPGRSVNGTAFMPWGALEPPV